MAKQRKTKRSAAIIEAQPVSSDAAVTNGQTIDQVAMSKMELFTLELARHPTVDASDEVEHYILFKMKHASHQDGRHVYFADVGVSKQKGESLGSSVVASYLLVFDTENKQDVIGENALRKIGKLAVWPHFSATFRSLIANTDLIFPPLPIEPPSMSVEELGT